MLILSDALLLLLPFAVLAADLFFNPRHHFRPAYRAAWVGLVVVFVVQCLAPHTATQTFWHRYEIAPWSLLMKQLFVVATLACVWLAKPYFEHGLPHRPKLTRGGEFFTMLCFCAGGMSVIVSSRDLVMLFVGLELATIPLYVMTAFHRSEEPSAEASMKYIVMGSLATALILFGYSLFYGAVGLLDFESIAAFAVEHPTDPLLVGGALFVLAAVGFKLAMAPFHMWAPDVYDGAPTPVTAFISSGSKAAALGYLLLMFCGPMEPLRGALMPLFGVLAALSMLVGNLGALRQPNFRRFMAYSSIAQVGYLLLAFVADKTFAMGAVIYYVAVYLAGNLAAFFVIGAVGRRRPEELASLRGLSRTNPGLAAVLMLSMFSLAGVPPLAGFTGKFLLFASAASSGHYVLLFFAAMNSVASLYYYMLVIKEAYITPPELTAPVVEAPVETRRILALASVALLALGVWPAFNDLVFRAAGY